MNLEKGQIASSIVINIVTMIYNGFCLARNIKDWNKLGQQGS